MKKQKCKCKQTLWTIYCNNHSSNFLFYKCLYRQTTSTVRILILSFFLIFFYRQPLAVSYFSQQLKNKNNNYRAEACRVITSTTDVPSSGSFLAAINAKRSIRIFNYVSNVFIKLTIRILRDIGTVYRRANIPEEKKKEQRYQMKRNWYIETGLTLVLDHESLFFLRFS